MAHSPSDLPSAKDEIHPLYGGASSLGTTKPSSPSIGIGLGVGLGLGVGVGVGVGVEIGLGVGLGARVRG